MHGLLTRYMSVESITPLRTVFHRGSLRHLTTTSGRPSPMSLGTGGYGGQQASNYKSRRFWQPALISESHAPSSEKACMPGIRY